MVFCCLLPVRCVASTLRMIGTPPPPPITKLPISCPRTFVTPSIRIISLSSQRNERHVGFSSHNVCYSICSLFLISRFEWWALDARIGLQWLFTKLHLQL
jgi:hypothetical protein